MKKYALPAILFGIAAVALAPVFCWAVFGTPYPGADRAWTCVGFSTLFAFLGGGVISL